MRIIESDLPGDVELRGLRSFRVLAGELHFGRAAVLIGLSQPALSHQIRRLEEQLGVLLVDRSTRRVQLTEAGHVLDSELAALFPRLEGALERTRRVGRGDTGTLTVAFAASVLFQTLPSILRAFRERYPDVTLELREIPTGPQLEALRAGTLDVGFVREPPPDPDLQLETVMREPLVAALPAEHPLVMEYAAAGGGVGAGESAAFPLERLADEPFVLFPEAIAPGLYVQVMQLCRSAGFAPRIVQESRELYTTVSLVEAGMGVTIVPASIRKMGWGGVAYLPLDGVGTRIDMAWGAHPTRPVVDRFLALVREELGGG